MTPEERAEKWFCGVPESKTIDLEKKVEISKKASLRIALIFFLLLFIECVALFQINDGALFLWLADTVSGFAEGNHTYKGLALVGSILVLPLLVFPVLIAFIFGKKWIRSEARKYIQHQERDS
ncbi:hypothetical protein [Atopobium sp. oral taxon 199]|uniref:hypothetical protein n=1 Tax=Atopobium sp. oral taxon 199 TaxID=712156 RepID=UPI00034EB0B9|nr:hypothetical protein [Atopobium sp. oral taxon 199]EPD78473.1 hypothetical protein HMPREF1527_00795 [Atopobium sp. oral taxon 199 str. F0494]